MNAQMQAERQPEMQPEMQPEVQPERPTERQPQRQPQREPSLAEQIVQVERRLDMRRQRTMRHLAEARTDVDHALRWLPLAGVVGALAVGVLVGRRPGVSPVANASLGGAPSFARTGILATLIGLAGTALRIAMSPQARALWAAYRDRRRGGATR